jgi:hypothetical protein
MSAVMNPEEKQALSNEGKNVIVTFVAMVLMLIFWLWLFFDVVQPWVESV